MINELDVIKNKRGDLFFKLVDLTKELNGPSLLMDTILSSKEQLLEQLNVLKVAWANKFTESIEFFEEEIRRWLVTYINRNDEVDDTLHQLGMDLREMENEMFEKNTKHEIMLPPMREYIEYWLRKSLFKITKLEQQETVAAIMPPQPQKESTKCRIFQVLSAVFLVCL
jgi:hypothetical protein